METEDQKADTSKDNATQTGGDQPEWMKGELGKIISILNQPGIASALASVGLYFAIDPKAIKNALEELKDINMQMLQKLNELVEENEKIKKQVKKLAIRDLENQPEERQMNGYRKVQKHRGSIYLD